MQSHVRPPFSLATKDTATNKFPLRVPEPGCAAPPSPSMFSKLGGPPVIADCKDRMCPLEGARHPGQGQRWAGGGRNASFVTCGGLWERWQDAGHRPWAGGPSWWGLCTSTFSLTNGERGGQELWAVVLCVLTPLRPGGQGHSLWPATISLPDPRAPTASPTPGLRPAGLSAGRCAWPGPHAGALSTLSPGFREPSKGCYKSGHQKRSDCCGAAGPRALILQAPAPGLLSTPRKGPAHQREALTVWPAFFLPQVVQGQEGENWRGKPFHKKGLIPELGLTKEPRRS